MDVIEPTLKKDYEVLKWTASKQCVKLSTIGNTFPHHHRVIMIQLVDSSEELELYITYCITIIGDGLWNADQLRWELEKALELVGWDPYLEHFTDHMYLWNGLWKYSLGHYVKIEYPSKTALCAVLKYFWETHLLSPQDIEGIELEESHRV